MFRLSEMEKWTRSLPLGLPFKYCQMLHFGSDIRPENPLFPLP